MGERQGETVQLEITNVAHGGVMVSRLDGRVVFVSDAIPGETVRAVISDDSKSAFWRAETVEVLAASEFRRPHIWPEAGIERPPGERAGGAEFGHIGIDHQRELKRKVLGDSLKRMAGIGVDAAVEALPGPEDGTGWRTRLRLHIADDGTPGPYAARSRRVVPVSSLPLAVPEAVAIAPLAERFAPGGTIDLVAPSTGAPFVLTEGMADRIVVERVEGREFRLDARGFWQVHREAAATLTDAVAAAVDESLFDPRAFNLDLYGGVGLLAAAVGDRFGATTRITSVESDAAATAHASRNLVEWRGASAVTGRVEHYLRRLCVSATQAERAQLARATVILDPPRSGAGRSVVESLLDLEPAQIVYVACDPVALARDVALLRDEGYELLALRAFDLFPNTHHLEAVARLVRTD